MWSRDNYHSKSLTTSMYDTQLYITIKKSPRWGQPAATQRRLCSTRHPLKPDDPSSSGPVTRGQDGAISQHHWRVLWDIGGRDLCRFLVDFSVLKWYVFDTDNKNVETEQEQCCACHRPIGDRFLLQVSGRSWHARCLRCSACHAPLDTQQSCFVREDRLYCKTDYVRIFGAKCAKCSRSIHASDWVRKAREQVYHLACFACDSCKRQLSTGEEFALHESRVLCKTHFYESMDNGSNDENADTDHPSGKAKSKRVRTTFTEEQLQVLQANFNLDSNPDGQDLERIAQITGLSKRVTQVWFQNSRARQKKYLNNQAKKANGYSPGFFIMSESESNCSSHFHDFCHVLSRLWNALLPVFPRESAAAQHEPSGSVTVVRMNEMEQKNKKKTS
ncbi:hypothetical protein JTE90_027565 [Oedothorax gibbosus]|uniref:LIM/homeobox protein Awh n=1 Tax=Oedothorax gibbosus TaxID=931172 RepID=A0AAV6VLF9_9ARAC|nr:hypothetical protein JTE90_027565 [Oedothorax gibbosus]